MTRVISVSARNFRSYERVDAQLGPGLTVVSGPNGAGKTNLLEAVYFGCTGRSCRTSNDRQLVRFGAQTLRVVVQCDGEAGSHQLAVGLTAGEAKRTSVDGVTLQRLLDSPHRPLVSVFLPDRLELVKGLPALRRAHVDQVVAALWPARVGSRVAYAQTLAQRNALLVALRSGKANMATLDSWDAQLSVTALALMATRAAAIDLIAQRFAQVGGALALDGKLSVSYEPRSHAGDPVAFAAELRQRRTEDMERGFTEYGPHRDDITIKRDGRSLRTYGSQGQQRLALLALLLAERSVLAQQRSGIPLMLLDDVMSELDSVRRRALIDLLHRDGGQALITTTDLEHVPVENNDVMRLQVSDSFVEPLAIGRA
ncbi:MAG: DNA replication/repair protein RecF [Solirubrobacteraceae bacterium]